MGKALATLVFMLGLLWAFFPGAFGVLNFNENRAQIIVWLVNIAWGGLMLLHVIAIYRIWFSGDRIYIWLISLLVMHVLFFATIARNVSTR